MNAFDLNRKEYIRVNNNNSEKLTDFKKVTFLTSFVITADVSKLLPPAYDPGTINGSNENLITNASQYCSEIYTDGDGYACYISEMGVLNSTNNVNIPYAKVNVYAMDGRDITV
jgi:hypothetical protein